MSELFLTASQIFSGQVPFHDVKSDYRIMAAVRDGTRPPRPSDNICHIRGLDDEIWTIIESCWIQEPSYRQNARQIVERLRTSPTWTVDERPLDNFDPSFPSRALYSQAEHPFSALPDLTNDAK